MSYTLRKQKMQWTCDKKVKTSEDVAISDWRRWELKQLINKKETAVEGSNWCGNTNEHKLKTKGGDKPRKLVTCYYFYTILILNKKDIPHPEDFYSFFFRRKLPLNQLSSDSALQMIHLKNSCSCSRSSVIILLMNRL